jgi:hypothetical protein
LSFSLNFKRQPKIFLWNKILSPIGPIYGDVDYFKNPYVSSN